MDSYQKALLEDEKIRKQNDKNMIIGMIVALTVFPIIFYIILM